MRSAAAALLSLLLVSTSGKRTKHRTLPCLPYLPTGCSARPAINSLADPAHSVLQTMSGRFVSEGVFSFVAVLAHIDRKSICSFSRLFDPEVSCTSTTCAVRVQQYSYLPHVSTGWIGLTGRSEMANQVDHSDTRVFLIALSSKNADYMNPKSTFSPRKVAPCAI